MAFGMDKYTPIELIADLRRQAQMKNALWPCVLLKDLLPLCDDNDRMRDRIEQLRGLCKWASGALIDAGDHESADKILELVGDMEPVV